MLGRRTEAAEHLHTHREFAQALADGAKVLLGQDGRRHQHGHLFAVENRFKGRPDRHFGLAIADIATDQAVHRTRRFHVLLDRFNGLELVKRLFVGEAGLHLLLPEIIWAVHMTSHHFPLGIEGQQIVGNVRHCPFGAFLDRLPVSRTQATDHRRLFTSANIAA